MKMNKSILVGAAALLAVSASTVAFADQHTTITNNLSQSIPLHFGSLSTSLGANGGNIQVSKEHALQYCISSVSRCTFTADNGKVSGYLDLRKAIFGTATLHLIKIDPSVKAMCNGKNIPQLGTCTLATAGSMNNSIVIS